MIPDELTHDNIRLVAERLRGHIRHTPVLEVAGADFGLQDMRLLFKLEYLQHGGSFKARGAFTHMLTRNVPAAGVVAASGGNHGVAVAFAAMRLGVRATIFVPSVCSPAKLDQIKRYGADVCIAGDRYADALAARHGKPTATLSQSTPSTNWKPYWARPQSRWSLKRRLPNSMRCWSRWAAED